MKDKKPILQRDPKRLKEFYALTLIIVPTALMGIVSTAITNFLQRTIAQVVILFLQGVTVKGIIENR